MAQRLDRRHSRSRADDAPVWRHRLQLRPDAQMEGVSADAVLTSVVQQTRVPI
jgi:MoxR-like ATPase